MAIFQALAVLLLATTALSTDIDYYWRNFNGDIPSDAFEAGKDSLGKPIYIGQGFFQNAGLLPGTLHQGHVYLKATAQVKVFATHKHIKILCTRHPRNLRWIRVNSYEDISVLTNAYLVQGGLETDSILNVGRARHEGDLEIGKIYNIGPYAGLALPNHDELETDYMSFDLLVYDPDVTNPLINEIDVRFIKK